MRILFLSRYQNDIERGAENFVKELSERLSKNHDVVTFTGRDSVSVAKILSLNPDIVIPINGRMQSIIVSLGRIIGRYKILITGHSGKGWDDILNILVRPNIFVALTDYLVSWAKRWAWGTKIIKISNGIDLNRFTIEGERLNLGLDRPIILSVGALVWYKHHERLIEAVSRMGNGSVLVVGQGLLRENLENLGRKKLGSRFKIAQFKNQDMPKVYRSVDLFTLPSWEREAFGLVYLEALASGLGVVAPDDPSRKEIIGDAGLFVDVTNPEQYAAALTQGLKIVWQKKSRKQAERFSWDKVAKKYEITMLDMLKSK